MQTMPEMRLIKHRNNNATTTNKNLYDSYLTSLSFLVRELFVHGQEFVRQMAQLHARLQNFLRKVYATHFSPLQLQKVEIAVAFGIQYQSLRHNTVWMSGTPKSKWLKRGNSQCCVLTGSLSYKNKKEVLRVAMK